MTRDPRLETHDDADDDIPYDGDRAPGDRIAGTFVAQMWALLQSAMGIRRDENGCVVERQSGRRSRR